MKLLNFRYLCDQSLLGSSIKRNAARRRRRAEDTLLSGVYEDKVGHSHRFVNCTPAALCAQIVYAGTGVRGHRDSDEYKKPA